MPLSYRTAAVANMGAILQEIRNEAETRGATINYYDPATSSSAGGLNFTIPNGTGRTMTLELYTFSTPDYYFGGLATGYNAGDGNDYSDQPGQVGKGNATKIIDPEGATTLHIISQASPFLLYVAAELDGNTFTQFLICDLATMPGDTAAYTLTTGTDLLADTYTQMLAEFPGGNDGTYDGGSYYVNGRYYPDDFNTAPYYFMSPLFNLAWQFNDIGSFDYLNPIPIFCNKNDGNLTQIGTIPGAYLTSKKGRGLAEQFTLGGKTYISFPVVSAYKTPPDAIDGGKLENRAIVFDITGA